MIARVLRRWDGLAVWLELIRNLAVRDVEIRYKHSLLGLYWAIINPLLTAAIFSFVFTEIFHARSEPIPYVVFLLTGLTFWGLFANGINSATGSITSNAPLLAKVYFPRVALPTAAMLARLIDFGFSLLVLGVFVLIYRTPLHWTALWIAPVLGLQIMFTLGICYLAASSNVLYRDVTQLTGLVLMIWMWLSPVMYSIDNVSPQIRTILLANPMGALLQAERELLFTGRLTNLPFLWAAAAWTCAVFFTGLATFKRIEPLFAEVM